MSADAPTAATMTERQRAPGGVLLRAENLLLSVALVALVLLPLTEALLRKLLHAGIPGSTAFVQHLTLIVTMLGAAAAARDGRLLTLFEFASLAGPRVRAAARLLGSWGAAAVSA